MTQKQFKSCAAHYLTLSYFIFGIMLREVFLLIALLFMLMMTLYHIFPQGWFKAIVRDLTAGRKAYNDAFGKKFAAAVKSHLVQPD